MAILTNARRLLTKIESSSGTDSSPAGTDALLVSNLEVSPVESGTAGREIIRPYLGATEQLLTDTKISISFDCELSGSGSAGTASRIDSLLRACGMAVATTGSAVTGSSQAGSAGSITLASGASATDDAYTGMCITITSGTGNSHKGLITSYTGSSKIATVQASTAAFTPGASSGYSISANVQYKPLSSTFESTTLYFNNGGIRHIATNCRGSFSFSLETGGIPVFSFSMIGVYNSPTDTAAGSTTYSNQSVPVVAKSGNTVATNILGYSPAVQSISFDMANEVAFRQLIGADKDVIISARNPSGEAVVELPTIAQKDYFTLANTESTNLVSLQQGTTAGNIVSFVAKKVDLSNPTLSDSDGIQHVGLPLSFLPTSGNDEVLLTFQ